MLDLLHFLAHWSLCHHIPFNSITEYFKNIFKKPHLIRTKICRIFEGQSWKQIIVVGKMISLLSLILRLLSSNEFFYLFLRSTSRGCQLLCTAECYLICGTIRSHNYKWYTTLQSMINAKLSEQRFWHCYKKAVSKPLLTEFGIHHRLESCEID